ncbi:MAG: pyridoxal phosphate-dependent aminotransferase [Phycisphaerae bacterium]
MRLSARSQNLTESATLAVSSRAAAMRREGIDVIGFGAGEPDFDTPAHITQAAKDALDAGHTRYARPPSGIPEARQAVCEKFRRENGLHYRPDQTMITVGAKEALALAFAAVLDPGDEVLLPVPYWVSFPEQIRLAGGVVVPIEPDDPADLRLRPERIAAAVTDKTRVLLFNSPSNPGGFAYDPGEVRAIAAAISGRDLLVFSDEMYDRIRFGTRRDHLSFAAVGDEWFEKTVTFNAASKSYAMTGWRIGYAAGPKPVIQAMARIQSHTTSGTATFIQHALVAALTGDQSRVEGMRAAFERRGQHMHARLNVLRGITCAAPSGGFFCFPDVSGAYRDLGVSGSAAFCETVLEKAHVALVPGAAFGADRHVRLSFALDMETMDRGLDRLETLLGRR